MKVAIQLKHLPGTRDARWRSAWSALAKAHAWLGAAVCLLMAFLAFTGAMLVYKDALLRAVVAGADRGAVTDIRSLADAAAFAERRFGRESVRFLVFASESFGLHEIGLAEGEAVWLDPSSLTLVEHGLIGTIAGVLFGLHHELLAGAFGSTVVGCIALSALMLVISGIVLWSRQPKRGYRTWPRRATRGEFIAMHRTWGVAIAFPAVLMLSTGAGLALPGVVKPALAALVQSPAIKSISPRSSGHGAIDWSEAIASALEHFPSAAPRILIWPTEAAAATIRLRQPNEWHANGRTEVYVSSSGEALAVRDALHEPYDVRLYNTFWPVHASRVGGALWQAITCAAGVGLGVLSIVAGVSFVKRLRRIPAMEPSTAAPR